MYCFKCKEIQDTKNKVGFRATCLTCGSDLHVCKNCKYYQRGKPSDCIVPNVEPVLDKEKQNFCEDFKPSDQKKDDIKSSAQDAEKKLFKDQGENIKPKSFKDLFKD